MLYAQLTRTVDGFHLWLLAASAAVIALAIVLVEGGVDLHWALLVLALSPWVTVVGYELRGHRHNEQVLAEAASGH